MATTVQRISVSSVFCMPFCVINGALTIFTKLQKTNAVATTFQQNRQGWLVRLRYSQSTGTLPSTLTHCMGPTLVQFSVHDFYQKLLVFPVWINNVWSRCRPVHVYDVLFKSLSPKFKGPVYITSLVKFRVWLQTHQSTK